MAPIQVRGSTWSSVADLLEMAATSSLAPPCSGASQGSHCRGTTRRVGEGAGGGPGVKGGVEAVLGVKDQAGVEDPSGRGIGPAR